jgi:hypothetical protein
VRLTLPSKVQYLSWVDIQHTCLRCVLEMRASALDGLIQLYDGRRARENIAAAVGLHEKAVGDMNVSEMRPDQHVDTLVDLDISARFIGLRGFIGNSVFAP